MPDLRQYANEQRYNLLYWQRRLRNRRLRPAPRDDERALVKILARDGGVVTSVAALSVPDTATMMAEADRLMASLLGRAPVKGGFGVQATPSEIAIYPTLIRWGLDERLLAIVGTISGSRYPID